MRKSSLSGLDLLERLLLSMMLLRAVCGSEVLLQLRSVLLSRAHVSAKGHVDVRGLRCLSKAILMLEELLPLETTLI